jgi:streptogramin lyase
VAAGFALNLSPDLVARADAYVYWTNSSGASIGRAGLDGTGVDRAFIATLGFPEAIAVDARHVYWTNASNAIGRARLDGSGIDHEFIEGSGTIGGVAVGSRHIYWSNRDEGTIGRAKRDGSDVDQEFISGGADPGHVAVDDAHVYWANVEGKSIGRGNSSGMNVDQGFIPTLGAPAGLEVDGDHVFWVNANITPAFQGAIGKADLDGTDIDQTFTTSAMSSSSGFLSGVTADADHIYWADFSYPSVARAALDGSAVESTFITTGLFSFPRDVAVDSLSPDEQPPETSIVRRPRDRIRRSRARYEFASSEQGSSFECRRDQRPFRPCGSPKVLSHLGPGMHRFLVLATDAAGNTDPSPARDRFRVSRNRG